MPPRFFRTLLPAVALLLAPLPPAAAQEKCVGPDGQTVCAPVRLQFFDVQGGDYHALLAALNARGRFHGRADWNLNYRYQHQFSSKGCSVAEITTTLDLVITLPRWQPPAGASRELVNRWERYLAALRAHEEGHLEHGRELEREFRRAAVGLVERTCDDLQARVKTVFGELLYRYQAFDKLYDEKTGHGRTQGAVFQ